MYSDYVSEDPDSGSDSKDPENSEDSEFRILNSEDSGSNFGRF